LNVMLKSFLSFRESEIVWKWKFFFQCDMNYLLSVSVCMLKCCRLRGFGLIKPDIENVTFIEYNSMTKVNLTLRNGTVFEVHFST